MEEYGSAGLSGMVVAREIKNLCTILAETQHELRDYHKWKFDEAKKAEKFSGRMNIPELEQEIDRLNEINAGLTKQVDEYEEQLQVYQNYFKKYEAEQKRLKEHIKILETAIDNRK